MHKSLFLLFMLMIGQVQVSNAIPFETDADVAHRVGIQSYFIGIGMPTTATELELIKNLKVKWLRVDMNWRWTEPVAGQYDWEPYRKMADALARMGIRPVFILTWANRAYWPTGKTRPSSADILRRNEAYARWAAAAAKEFKDMNPVWELWNEPESNVFWPPKANPDDYLTMATAACQAIREADPQATIMGPAAAYMPTRWNPKPPFFEKVTSNRPFMQCIDAISIHTHRFTQRPETVRADLHVTRRELHKKWDTTTLPPIVASEWGDSVYKKGISEELQAIWLPRMLLLNIMENIPLTIWYNWKDSGPNPSEREDRFGLITEDLSTRPSYQAYQVLLQQLGNYKFDRILSESNVWTNKGANILLFRSDDEYKVAAWSSMPMDVQLEGFEPTENGVDYLGRQRQVVKLNAKWKIHTTNKVVYIPVQSLDASRKVKI